MREGIAALRSVPGRFERVDCGQPFLVIVDYAHTDDALRNLLATARELSPKGRIIALFGCGGDRDRAKRPMMGEAAGRAADFVVLTSDNPRSEDPLLIINDALVGLQRTRTPYKVEANRERAIGIALDEARAGDIVLLAGKGHETYQVMKDKTLILTTATWPGVCSTIVGMTRRTRAAAFLAGLKQMDPELESSGQA